MRTTTPCAIGPLTVVLAPRGVRVFTTLTRLKLDSAHDGLARTGSLQDHCRASR